jgi:hypothetical protein
VDYITTSWVKLYDLIRERISHGLNELNELNPRGRMAKRSFWVLSKQPKEIGGFGKRPVPAQFKTVEEASKYCKELNLKRGAYHPGYFIEERIGNTPVSAPKKKAEDTEEIE